MLNNYNKRNLFLKKSYNVRKILDIVKNSPYVVFIHKENLKDKEFNSLKSLLIKKGVQSFLINKDNFNHLPLVKFAYGPTYLFYSFSYFFNEIKSFFLKNNLPLKLILNKNQIFLSEYFWNLIMDKYSNSIFFINSYLFFLIKNYYYFLFIFNNFLFSFNKKLWDLLNYCFFILKNIFLFNIIKK